MRLTVAAVGRARGGPVRTLFDDYAGRLPWQVRLQEIAEADGPQRKTREGEKLLAAIPDGAVLVALDEHGKVFDSRQLAGWVGKQRDEGQRDLAFIIGGADGLAEPVLKKAGLILSLGALTWPHMMVRAMLMEQIYRAHTILTGHPYHRD
ncbi:MAG: 23S rRNA (pseudouridine(1915)-N(3))-methyltransferase RlmH [Alphaproteobacteria bacterium]|jgi:23S rRNA (pseudouridine1915-N3)-methyltransferase|nr:23S rRNA (pseudouridine(1915)-N(3))-methyltransferase RlmH [Rhodospirillaceae bacterium]MBT6202534.1 23S rRNA (pseudouridine(1915)-N(3))-methyltransferase RlmH [Rhodospirillaceae bacterium]MBT6512731.1 23S rRNA (pseudouridine(1915)-N(3))-methyltransferase RlmH [Rhodospirillaceae bacterium]MBT7648916.1 23S rRNA (pseudouridine(1915)-N(3))-methyltransferase RlmH [Rhodospirillaceae bacterium]MDG2479855.1 23S rRNA (pseudouridine(1915)-N(3))-methyltransferase RlmH [Alphaproteobacteria bacterium]